MKRKLITVLILISLSLTGIIVFQTYWTFNAYKANKKIFEGKIDAAMQQALDSCKRDYFDSIRVVLVKRLSDSTTVIRIDTQSVRTGPLPKTGFKELNPGFGIWISINGSRQSNPFQTSARIFNYYRSKINHAATVPEVITEMSFYVPLLLTELTDGYGIYDFMHRPPQIMKYINANRGKPGFQFPLPQNGIWALPPNYKQADSLKLSSYLTKTLSKMNINTPFKIQLTNKATKSNTDDPFLSETTEYKYQYHGFAFLLTHYTEQLRPTLYSKAVFQSPQYTVIRGMLVTLLLSALLILFTMFSFYYIIHIINQQKALSELKDDFINNMTHELKTPIATITVAVEGLQKFNALNDPEKVERYLQTSRNELNRLNELVSKVLDVATFESDKITLIKEKIQIDDLMNELITAQKSKTNKTVNITYHNHNNIGYIVADKLHFSNVILNILDNAVKYAGEQVNITINLRSNNEMVAFVITDNGMGISQVHVNRVFEKFYRVPTGNLHNVKGTGLGLSYVKYIVEAHGGVVAVKSELNKGSEFAVLIPA